MAKYRVLYVWMLAFWYFEQISAAKITSLDVPKTAWDAVNLNCKYDLENGTLYAVKWYKDNVEFFRCAANGTVQEYPLKDIKIYHKGSSQLGSCFFELTPLTPRSGGEYRCEVSLDWPTFDEVSRSTHLQVSEPPAVSPKDATESVLTYPVVQAKGSTYAATCITLSLIFLLISYMH